MFLVALQLFSNKSLGNMFTLPIMMRQKGKWEGNLLSERKESPSYNYLEQTRKQTFSVHWGSDHIASHKSFCKDCSCLFLFIMHACFIFPPRLSCVTQCFFKYIKLFDSFYKLTWTDLFQCSPANWMETGSTENSKHYLKFRTLISGPLLMFSTQFPEKSVYNFHSALSLMFIFDNTSSFKDFTWPIYPWGIM